MSDAGAAGKRHRMPTDFMSGRAEARVALNVGALVKARAVKMCE